jgi:hypothetical protein
MPWRSLRREARVEDGHVVSEARPVTRDELRRERDLGDEHDVSRACASRAAWRSRAGRPRSCPSRSRPCRRKVAPPGRPSWSSGALVAPRARPTGRRVRRPRESAYRTATARSSARAVFALDAEAGRGAPPRRSARSSTGPRPTRTRGGREGSRVPDPGRPRIALTRGGGGAACRVPSTTPTMTPRAERTDRRGRQERTFDRPASPWNGIRESARDRDRERDVSQRDRGDPLASVIAYEERTRARG